MLYQSGKAVAYQRNKAAAALRPSIPLQVLVEHWYLYKIVLQVWRDCKQLVKEISGDSSWSSRNAQVIVLLKRQRLTCAHDSIPSESNKTCTAERPFRVDTWGICMAIVSGRRTFVCIFEPQNSGVRIETRFSNLIMFSLSTSRQRFLQEYFWKGYSASHRKQACLWSQSHHI